ncbi:MAG: c-type cytochrome [Bacteroidetes bacterium]|nr:c-type cytochrome [Bacteroidota bacterium]
MSRALISYTLAAGALALCMMSACKDDTTTNPQPTSGDKAHGEYLVKHVAACGECHTQRNEAGVFVDSLTMAGGREFPVGSVGSIFAPNITPDTETGIGSWTDQQIIAAIRTGRLPDTEDGKPTSDTVISPVMPYWLYANMTDSDVNDIVAYLRSLKPVHYEPTENTVPASLLVRWAPQAGIPDATPNNAQTQRGKYLVTLARCIDCHTAPAAGSGNPLAQGVDVSRFLAGGNRYVSMADPNKFITAKNITPDDDTGIGGWSTGQIDSALALGWDDQHEGLCPTMPWASYNAMVKADRDAIIAYLRGIPSVKNDVAENDPGTSCQHP